MELKHWMRRKPREPEFTGRGESPANADTVRAFVNHVLKVAVESVILQPLNDGGYRAWVTAPGELMPSECCPSVALCPGHPWHVAVRRASPGPLLANRAALIVTGGMNGQMTGGTSGGSTTRGEQQ